MQINLEKTIVYPNGASKMFGYKLRVEECGEYVRLWDGEQQWWPPLTLAEWAAILRGDYSFTTDDRTYTFKTF